MSERIEKAKQVKPDLTLPEKGRTMSKTPRTDALLLAINEGRTYEDDGPQAGLCRQLEEQLAEARADVIRAVEAGRLLSETYWGYGSYSKFEETLDQLFKKYGGRKISEPLVIGNRCYHGEHAEIIRLFIGYSRMDEE